MNQSLQWRQQISLTMVRGHLQSTRRSHLINAQRQAIVKEFERRQNVGEDVSQKDLSEWAFKELQLTTLPSQPTIPRLCKKRSHAYDERVVNPNRKRKSKGMHPKIEKALLTWVNEMHTQGVNVSSEMIKEMGIRILDGVNEMCPDEKKIHVTLSNGPFIDVNANCPRSW